MPTLDEQGVATLQKVVRDIAARAERLEQLLELGHEFRACDTSYRLLARDISEIPASYQNINWPRLNDRWASARDNDLSSLQALLDNAGAVRRNLAEDPAGGYAPQLDTWIAQIKELSERLQKALDEASARELGSVCTAFQSALGTQMAAHKNMLQREAKKLSMTAEKLREKLEG